MKVLDTQAIQQWEKQTIDAGVPTEILMEQAVNGLHRIITERFPAGRALIACGKGNNGNDALWLAQALRNSGWNITIWSSHPVHERIHVESDPKPISQSLDQAIIYPAKPDHCFDDSEPLLIIDGVLGLGATGAPRGTAAEIIHWLMEHRRPQDICFSIDTPSGLDGNTGEINDPCFHADFTIAIGAVKTGCLQDSATTAVGRLSATSIALNQPEPAAALNFFTIEDARSLISHRKTDTYKHRQGTVHIWAGSPGMSGASILASHAALRSGAGLVRLFTSEETLQYMPSISPEVMVESITLSKKINRKIFEADTLLLGPGIGLNQETFTHFEEIIRCARSPLVIDADAITHCSSDQSLLASLPPETILTPHIGEFSRMLPQPYESRASSATLFNTLNPDLILALKGPNTLIASRTSGLSYNGSGNPGMATAGSGDVLAGLIAGLRSGGFDAWNAARLGVFWHGFAGDIATQTGSEDTAIATDIIQSLGLARAKISRP